MFTTSHHRHEVRAAAPRRSWITRVALSALLVAPVGLGCRGLGVTKGDREKQDAHIVTQLGDAVSQEERIRGRQFETDADLLTVIDAALEDVQADPSTDLAPTMVLIDERVATYPETMDFEELGRERDILMSRFDAVLASAATAELRKPVGDLKRATNKAFASAMDAEALRGGTDAVIEADEEARKAAEVRAEAEARRAAADRGASGAPAAAPEKPAEDPQATTP